LDQAPGRKVVVGRVSWPCGKARKQAFAAHPETA